MIRKKSAITYLAIGVFCFTLYFFINWLDSPGEVEFHLNRNDERVYNQTDTLQIGQEFFYRFVQLKEPEYYQITIIDKETEEVFNTFTIDVPEEIRNETAISGKHKGPFRIGTYTFKVQDIQNDILVATGDFRVID